MGGVMLLREAWAAKLTVEAGPNGQLRIHGPASSEAVVEKLRTRKQEVLAALAERERFAGDPRPDLATDSPLWSALLVSAYDLDGENPRGLFGALHYLRCGGAAMGVGERGASIRAGELPTGEYEELRRQILLPHRAALTRLLATFSTEAAHAASRLPNSRPGHRRQNAGGNAKLRESVGNE